MGNLMKAALRKRLLPVIVCASLSSGLHADPVGDALAAPGRPDADHQRDLTSQPAAVLRFAGLSEEMVVLDLFAGSGYYSEIIAGAVGPDGTVYLHNNAAYLGFAGADLEKRLHGDRLPNVIRYDRELDAFDLPADSVDLVIAALVYHDVYFKNESWDVAADVFFDAIHRVLKPGGTLLIIDHEATAGSGNSAAQELHRIDPEFARRDIAAHGFEFAGELETLQNTADPLDISVFDPAVRRKTSRFVYKFVEPAD
jgi:predicted methyltransferase